ncbi:hypothetical protein D8674_009889 [Pyrus ussuriensis x Pyrus communis]|uniref:Pentatricopeptide repeat-containing protein n=1 Tax=Pyrus ussuriensis x Pyrus communis TaxID=2448454 RepID=A0A5N5F992_9ROSA|nr:hypothetical protein D8674_009889 [Pyrus ussuriensis x Pyrus communis]
MPTSWRLMMVVYNLGFAQEMGLAPNMVGVMIHIRSSIYELYAVQMFDEMLSSRFFVKFLVIVKDYDSATGSRRLFFVKLLLKAEERCHDFDTLIRVLEIVQNLINVGTDDNFHMLYNTDGNGFHTEQGDVHEDIMTWNKSEVDEFNHPYGLQDCRWFNYVVFSGFIVVIADAPPILNWVSPVEIEAEY